MMEKYSTQSTFYKDVTISRCQPTDFLVSVLRKDILSECDEKVAGWFTSWPKDLWYCLVATVDGKPFSIASARQDGKVMCYLYTLKEYRVKYRDLAQTDYTRIFIDNATTDSLYLTIDAFSNKHKRLAKAWDRTIMNGQIPNEFTPYKGKWKYEGIKEYRGVDQHFYRLNIKEVV